MSTALQRVGNQIGEWLKPLTSRVTPAVNKLSTRLSQVVDQLRTWLTPVVNKLRAWWRYTDVITPVGWFALGGAILFTWLGLRFGWVETLVIGLGCLIALIIAVLSTLGRLNYVAELEVDATRVRVGDHLLGQLKITNQGRRQLTNTLFELPVGRGAATISIPPMGSGAVHEQIFTVPTKRRSVINIGPVRSVKADPLSLLRRTRDWSDQIEVFVHPHTILVDADTSGVLRDIEGITTQDLSSSDVSFHALRDYVPGDDRRAVHWRSTARLGRLIVRQFEETRKTHLLVVLSLAVEEYASEEEFENAISVAGSLVLQAAREERDVTLYTHDGSVNRRTATLVLDELCRLEGTKTKRDLAALTLEAVEALPDATVAALISGSQTTPAQLLRASIHIPSEIRAFAVRSDESSPAGIKRIGNMNVLSIATLEDLPRAIRSMR